MPRAFAGRTPPWAGLIASALAQFAAVPDCTRRVIDISGDGPENAGFTDARAPPRRPRQQGVEINAIAIESLGVAITTFYRTLGHHPRRLRGDRPRLHDYAETLRQKMLREVAAALY